MSILQDLRHGRLGHERPVGAPEHRRQQPGQCRQRQWRSLHGLSGASTRCSRPCTNARRLGTTSQSEAAVQRQRHRESQAAPQMRYDPGNPLANADGYVYAPNVNVVEEMADMISASRSYQNNVEVMNTSRTSARDAQARPELIRQYGTHLFRQTRSPCPPVSTASSSALNSSISSSSPARRARPSRRTCRSTRGLPDADDHAAAEPGSAAADRQQPVPRRSWSELAKFQACRACRPRMSANSVTTGRSLLGH